MLAPHAEGEHEQAEILQAGFLDWSSDQRLGRDPES